LAHWANLQILRAVGARLHSESVIGYHFIHVKADGKPPLSWEEVFLTKKKMGGFFFEIGWEEVFRECFQGT
jgi:hypothetical protein